MPQPVFASSFRGIIGIAREDITPPAGIYTRNWGAAGHDRAEGIHRPLNATALTLQSSPGKSPFVLVAMDLGWYKSLEDEWLLRGPLLAALNLDPAQVLLNLSHTHSAPVICADDADKPGGELLRPYAESVAEALIRAVRRALASAVPATLDWAYGHCDLARNRDLPDPDQSPPGRLVCGYNPRRAAADNMVLVGRVTGNEGRILAVLANYACHPTTLGWQNRLISPDFVGAFNEVVETTTGALSLFLQGASGELAPREQYSGDAALADKNGRCLGYSVLAVLENMVSAGTQLQYSGTLESGAPLAAWELAERPVSGLLRATQVNVHLQLKELPSQEEIALDLEACSDRTARERLQRKRAVRRLVGNGASHALPLWVWQIGETFLVAQMTEAYSDWQAKLRRLFPGHALVVMNLTNGSVGYLPPAHLYELDVYQVWQSPYCAGGLESLIEASRRAIASFDEAPPNAPPRSSGALPPSGGG